MTRKRKQTFSVHGENHRWELVVDAPLRVVRLTRHDQDEVTLHAGDIELTLRLALLELKGTDLPTEVYLPFAANQQKAAKRVVELLATLTGSDAPPADATPPLVSQEGGTRVIAKAKARRRAKRPAPPLLRTSFDRDAARAGGAGSAPPPAPVGFAASPAADAEALSSPDACAPATEPAAQPAPLPAEPPPVDLVAPTPTPPAAPPPEVEPVPVRRPRIDLTLPADETGWLMLSTLPLARRMLDRSGEDA